MNKYLLALRSLLPATLLLAVAFCAGCSRSGDSTTPPMAVHKHEHHPPHGGAPVELGNEEYHVEFVRDKANGKLQAYVLDGELENFVRLPAKSLELSAQVAGKTEELRLDAVANPATGETVGDTSLFEGAADWLKQTTNFDAVLKTITVRSSTYTNVSFNFPKGSDENAKK